MARAPKLPIFERRSDDGRLMGYQVKIRKKGWPAVVRQYDKLADARTFALDTLAQMERGVFQDRREIEAVTLADALDRYDRDIGPTKKRPDGVTGYVRRWKQHRLASRIIATLRPGDFAAYRDERLKEGAAGNTVRLELGLVRHLYTIGIKEWGWPVSNPVSNIRMPKCAAGRERRLEPGEEERLLEACNASRSPWLTPFVRLAIETGARRQELVGLRWGQIDLDHGTAFIADSKTDVPRTIPLSPTAIAVLQVLPRSLDGRVFPLAGVAVTHAFQRACERAGIADFHLHDLRHEATSRLFEKGFGMQEVAAITGHKTLQMLKRYTHLRAEDLAAKLAEIG